MMHDGGMTKRNVRLLTQATIAQGLPRQGELFKVERIKPIKCGGVQKGPEAMGAPVRRSGIRWPHSCCSRSAVSNHNL